MLNSISYYGVYHLDGVMDIYIDPTLEEIAEVRTDDSVSSIFGPFTAEDVNAARAIADAYFNPEKKYNAPKETPRVPLRINDMWMNYVAKVIPSAATPGQIENIRYAFYTGAGYAFDLIEAAGTAALETKDDGAGVKILSQLGEDVNAFIRSAKASQKVKLD